MHLLAVPKMGLIWQSAWDRANESKSLSPFRIRGFHIRGGRDSVAEDPAEDGGDEGGGAHSTHDVTGSSSASSESDDDAQGPFLCEDEFEALNRPNRRRLLRRQEDHIVYNRF